ncbi:MAG: type IV pilus assembly protein PilM [Planctomycetes bacterium]|nr:type IV pilus assembly protein PilM [Planctomycetota bacterium]
MASSAWGIDIGGSSIKFAKIVIGKAGPEVCVLESVPLEFDADTPAEDRTQKTVELLSSIREKHKIKKSDIVYIAIPGHTVFHKNIPVFSPDEESIPELVEIEAQQQIPFPITEILWDYQRMTKDFVEGEDVQIALYAVRKDVSNKVLGALAEAKITVDGIQVAPLSIYNYAAYDWGADRGTIVVDIGSDNTDLVICDGAKTWTRNINIAGNSFTATLAKHFNIAADQAETLKIKAAKAKDADRIYQLLKPTLQDLIDKINQSIGYFKSQSDLQKFQKLVLLGSGAKLLGIKHMFSQKFPYKIEKIETLGKLKLHKDLDVAEAKKNVSSFSTAIGLAVQGIGLGEINVNLLPKEATAGKRLARLVPILGASYGLIIVAMLVWGFVLGLQTKNAQTAAISLNKLEWAIYEKEFEQQNANSFDAIHDEIERVAELAEQDRVVAEVQSRLIDTLDNYRNYVDHTAVQGIDGLYVQDVDVVYYPLNLEVVLTKFDNPTHARDLAARLSQPNQSGDFSVFDTALGGAAGSIKMAELVRRTWEPLSGDEVGPGRPLWSIKADTVTDDTGLATEVLRVWFPTSLRLADPDYFSKSRELRYKLLDLIQEQMNVLTGSGMNKVPQDEFIKRHEIVVGEESNREWTINMKLAANLGANRAGLLSQDALNHVRKEFWIPFTGGFALNGEFVAFGAASAYQASPYSSPRILANPTEVEQGVRGGAARGGIEEEKPYLILPFSCSLRKVTGEVPVETRYYPQGSQVEISDNLPAGWKKVPGEFALVVENSGTTNRLYIWINGKSEDHVAPEASRRYEVGLGTRTIDRSWDPNLSNSAPIRDRIYFQQGYTYYYSVRNP